MKYRPDIDGLRAIAIVIVVAYHAGIPIFSGGFIGVDVFFVISGFLITGILRSELESTGSISWSQFYARRIRRLIPALVVVSLTTLTVGVFVLVPDPELRWLGQSVGAVSLFLSNVFFYLKTSGYFGADADLQPLLNMWSLAVEEQFYVVWPVVLLLVHRLSRRSGRRSPWVLRATLTGLATGSLVAAELVVSSNQSAAFYLLPFRLWELAAGGLLSLVIHRVVTISKAAGLAMALSGLLLIVLSTTLLDASDQFPGKSAFPSVLGTVLVLAAGAGSSANAVSRTLSAGPLVWLGKLSYSWYLIHWPALVFARIVTLRSDLPRDVAISLAALLAGWLSFKYIEEPFRRQRWRVMGSTRTTLIAGLSVLALLATVGLGMSRYTQTFSRLDISPAIQEALAQNRTANEICPLNPAFSANPVDCQVNVPGARKSLVLTGDSHALAVMPMLQQASESLRMNLIVMWDTGCPFLIIERQGDSSDECDSENYERTRYLAQNRSTIGGLFITSRSTSYGDDAWWKQQVEQVASFVESLDRSTVYMLDVPHSESDVPECLIRTPKDCQINRKAAARTQLGRTVAERAAFKPVKSARVLNPFDALCGRSVCKVENDGRVLYRDSTHLSHDGARYLGSQVGGWLQGVYAEGQDS